MELIEIILAITKKGLPNGYEAHLYDPGNGHIYVCAKGKYISAGLAEVSN